MQEQKVIIETVGTITKKEDLIFFENPKNIMAFETAHAYPGYNGIVPQNYDPNSIFLITKGQYLTEDIFIHSQNIRKSVDFHFSAAVATVDYQNKKYPAIRIKGIKNYSFIPDLIGAYIEQGINFEKKKNVPGFNTLIQVKKEFMLKPLDDECYKDLLDDHMYYFEIPELLDWDTFEEIITDIKYNHPGLNFDAALSLLYRATKVVYAVRIFKEEVKMEELQLLKEQFYKRN